jgi:Na+/proline symporter
MGASSKMADGGLMAVIEDPFGASLCLILVGLFFARPLYRMRLLTFGDYYREVFGKRAEFIAAAALILSYFGWIAAQMIAIGIVLNIVIGMNVTAAIIASSAVVVFYTYIGGMWSVAITDLIHMIFTVIGLIIATFIIVNKAGGMQHIIAQTPSDYFNFLPQNSLHHWIFYIAAWLTVGLGSIPQQDVYQRVMSSRTEKIAVNSSYVSALLYLTVALLPLLLGLAARIMVPGQNDAQLLLPNLIMQYTDTWVQILFFGALISAITSTASGALLAPSVILSENILKPRLKNVPDKKFLLITRMSVVAIALISLVIALVSNDIYELVSQASQISLVSLFVPLCAGLFLKSKNETAAIISMISGMAGWMISLWLDIDFPSIFSGLMASAGGFLIGVLVTRSKEKNNTPCK